MSFNPYQPPVMPDQPPASSLLRKAIAMVGAVLVVAAIGIDEVVLRLGINVLFYFAILWTGFSLLLIAEFVPLGSDPPPAKIWTRAKTYLWAGMTIMVLGFSVEKMIAQRSSVERMLVLAVTFAGVPLFLRSFFLSKKNNSNPPIR